jgi:reactive intermediate/imine deaminase
MNDKQAIKTAAAPAPIGAYSQAIKTGNTVYLSGQIPLDPHSGELVIHSVEAQANQVFKNLAAVAEAAGGSLDHIVKVTVFLTNLSDFPIINAAMAKYFNEPFPARSTIEVSKLPKEVAVEIEAIMAI